MTNFVQQPDGSAASLAIGSYLSDTHAFMAGGTRKGKSFLFILYALASLNIGEGITCIDPHGSFVRILLEHLANPANGFQHRVVHCIDPASGYTIGINPLQPHEDSPEGWHEAALRLATVVEARFDAPPDQLVRLARIMYVAGYVAARHGLTVNELLEMLSFGGHELRRTLLEDMPNRVVCSEMADLHRLAETSPREFYNYVESSRNRFVRWISDRRLARILCQRRGLDARAVMDGGHAVLFDGSSLPYADAGFMGCLINSVYFDAARRRPPLNNLRHRLLIDEAENSITVVTARTLDQTAKFGLLCCIALQRLQQALQRGDNLLDALLVNCALKICFGLSDPVSARFMTEVIHTGNIDLQEWKAASVRPTAVGNELKSVRGTARAQHHAETSATSTSSSRATGSMHALSDINATAWGSVFSSGTTTGSTALSDGSLFTAPTPIGVSAGHNQARASSASGSRARGESTARHATEAHTTSESHGTGQGQSVAETESET